MTNTRQDLLLVSDIFQLPSEAKTRSGILFNPCLVRWSYRDENINVSLNFERLNAISTEMLHSLKQVLMWYAKNMSASHLMNMHQRFEHFIRTISIDRYASIDLIDTTAILNYRAQLTHKNMWYLGSLSGLFKQWHELGYDGIAGEVVALLKRLRIQGNIKGEAVLTADPNLGAFTDIEVEAIQMGLEEAMNRGRIQLEYYLLAQLYLLLGQRSVQYAALKVCDVNVSITKDGAATYMMRIPRAKQRGQLSRTDFKDRILIPKIGRLLADYAAAVKQDFVGKLSDSSQAPLFPAKTTRVHKSEGFQYHRTADALAKSLEVNINKLGIKSERTGKSLHITARRFRRTIGARAATEGHGELVIAELLDHADTQNVGVYVEATPGMVERIDKAIVLQLAPMAQAFQGMIITDESKAVRASDPQSRICAPQIVDSMAPMGNCGKFGFCGAFAPIACYTCSNFQPWLDGPHEAVLSSLIDERDRLLVDSDIRIASVNDRTILAVAEVVRRCDDMKREAGEVLHD